MNNEPGRRGSGALSNMIQSAHFSKRHQTTPTDMKYASTLFLFASLIATSTLAQLPGSTQPIKIVNEAAVNSENLDYSPAFLEDGIVFISNRESDRKLKYTDPNIKQNTFSLFQSTRNMEGVLNAPVLFGTDVNSKLHEGPMTFSRDQSEMFFCQNNLKKGKEVKAKDKKIKMNIYKAVKGGKDWTYAQEPIFNDMEYDYMHPSVSVDGSKLYFSSNRPGGLGGMDIWVADLKNGAWGEPRNLGAPVNSPGDDVFPFIHADGTLFYSSNIPTGAGGLDLYYANPDGDIWTNPKNLTDFNTDKDDFGLIVDRDKRNGYFSSDRPGGKGSDDIYTWNSKTKIGIPPPEMLTVKVLDLASGQVLPDACMSYFSRKEMQGSTTLGDGSNLVANGNATALRPAAGGTGCTDTVGIYVIPMPTEPMVFNVEHPDYKPAQINFVPAKGVKEVLIPLQNNPTDQRFTLVVRDENTGLPIPGGKVRVTNDQTGEEFELLADANGQVKSGLPCGSSYTLDIEARGKKSKQAIPLIPCEKNKPMTLDTLWLGDPAALVDTKPGSLLPPSALKEGVEIQLPNIYYNFNDHQIRPDAQQDLDRVVTLLKAYPELVLELGSHTDSRGGDGYNDTLSQRRAESARIYLLDQGALPEQIEAKGYGEHKLQNNCADGVLCDEREHQINRRTMIKVVKAPQNVKAVAMNNAPSVVDPAPPSVLKYVNGLVETGRAVKMVNDNPISADSGSTFTTSTSSSAVSTTVGKVFVDRQIQSGKKFDNYILIAGSFANMDNARNQAATAKALGFNNVDVRYERSMTLISVVVGPYADVDEAKANAQKLSDAGMEVFLTYQK
jgi:outer membrane protein OmpA-like peptidoglycan-associated protein